LWLILIAAGALFLGKKIFLLMRYVREPVLITFSTATSDASLPRMFEALDRFGVPRRVSVSCCRWAMRSTSTGR
jgi:Na+/H+-dicarboxylate symporter